APVSGSPVFSGSVLNVNGWAVAPTGVERVEIWIDNQGPYEATYGLMREDVRARYGSIPNTEHSGFSWCRSTSEIGAGAHRARVRAVSRSACAVEASVEFQVDERSLYQVWADVHTPSAADLKRIRQESGAFAYRPKISIVTPVYRTPEAFIE